MPPHASSRARSIRQRSNGIVDGGTRLAACAQYSTSRRGRRSRARSSSAGSYGPSREKNGTYWLRASTFTLSICTMPSRSMVRCTCRIVTGPVGRGSAKPCAASAIRRAAAAVSRSGSGHLSRRAVLEVAGRAVELLAQEVRVAVVPRVLLEHVQEDPAHR